MQANERRSYLESVGAYNDVGSVRGIGTSLIGLAAIEAVEGRAVEEGRSLSVTEALELARAGHSVVDE